MMAALLYESKLLAHGRPWAAIYRVGYGKAALATEVEEGSNECGKR